MMRLPICLFSVALISAGCGATPEPATPTSPTAQHGAYAHCLNEHGVDESSGAAPGPAPGPAPAPAGVDQATWDAAVHACASLAPGPGTP